MQIWFVISWSKFRPRSQRSPSKIVAMQRFISFGGLFGLIGLAWLMSSHKRRVSLRVVIGGLLLQFLFAILILKTAPGRNLFVHIGNTFETLLSYVNAGSEFVFGTRYTEFYFAF